jgi:hypothetical protein
MFPLLTTFPPSEPSRWGAAMGIYMIGFITYGATLVFYTAAFPRLARNTPRARELRDKYQAGEIPAEEYEVEESLEKNRISNISTVRSWLRSSSLPPCLLFKDPQQHRIRCHALPKPDSAVASERKSEGQQLCFSVVRTGIVRKVFPRR